MQRCVSGNIQADGLGGDGSSTVSRSGVTLREKPHAEDISSVASGMGPVASIESSFRFQRVCSFPLDEISVSDRSSDFATPPAAHRNLPVAARQRARYATMALFFIAGMMYASWGVHVPTVRDRFHLNPSLLSFALLAVAVGSIAAMATNAKWIARVGTRRACLAGGLTMSASGALILVVPSYWLLLVVLAVFGAAMATLDVAMNAEASAVEEALARPIMSALHGMFSVGRMMAAARFAGDAVRARFGAPQLIMASASLACAGMIGALLLPYPIAAMTGFTLMGLGLANMMPVLFAAAARVEGIHAAEGLAHVAGLAYFGLLIGPVIIGGVAQVTTLPIGLSVVAVCSALIAVA